MSIASVTAPLGERLSMTAGALSIPNVQESAVATLASALPSATDHDERYLLAIVDGQTSDWGRVQGDLALAVLSDAVAQSDQTDDALTLKQAFRRANEAVYEATRARLGESEGGLSLLAMITRGKYATVAAVGDGRGYLVRAGRLNQITRDQRTDRPRSRRATEPAKETRTSGGSLIGTAQRLESRLPIVFEITLLPEDRVLLANQALYSSESEQSLLGALVTGEAGLAMLPAGDGDHVPAAAWLTVAPARPPLEIPTTETAAGRSWLPIAAATVLMVALLALVLVLVL